MVVNRSVRLEAHLFLLLHEGTPFGPTASLLVGTVHTIAEKIVVGAALIIVGFKR